MVKASKAKSHEGANYGGTDTDALGEKLRLERMIPAASNVDE